MINKAYPKFVLGPVPGQYSDRWAGPAAQLTGSGLQHSQGTSAKNRKLFFRQVGQYNKHSTKANSCLGPRTKVIQLYNENCIVYANPTVTWRIELVLFT